MKNNYPRSRRRMLSLMLYVFSFSLLALGGTRDTHAAVFISSPAGFSGNETIATYDDLSVACGDPVLNASGVDHILTSGEGPRLLCFDTDPREFGPAGIYSIDNFPAPFEDLRLTFPEPINRLGFELRTISFDDIEVTLICLSDGVIIDQFTFPTPTHSSFTFYGFEAAMTFDEVIIDVEENASGKWRLDNLRFEQTAANPVAQIEQLITSVLDLDLTNGIENSLLAKLENALAKLEDNNPNNDGAAINKLEAFINQVAALSGNKIPEANADALIIDAVEIIITVLLDE